MKLGFYSTIWLIGALAIGCESQASQGAALSLQRESQEAKRSVYDDVELIAGSGAEEDEPVDEDEADAEIAEPDAGSIDDRLAEEMGWSDDSPLCGNGVLDVGERCDYTILEGRGKCPASCDPEPGCPDETLVVRGCQTHCMLHEEPSDECLAAD
jgi:hypothetical protein